MPRHLVLRFPFALLVAPIFIHLLVYRFVPDVRPANPNANSRDGGRDINWLVHMVLLCAVVDTIQEALAYRAVGNRASSEM